MKLGTRFILDYRSIWPSPAIVCSPPYFFTLVALIALCYWIQHPHYGDALCMVLFYMFSMSLTAIAIAQWVTGGIWRRFTAICLMCWSVWPPLLFIIGENRWLPWCYAIVALGAVCTRCILHGRIADLVAQERKEEEAQAAALECASDGSENNG